MSNGLCWKCRQEWIDIWGDTNKVVMAPWQHCHHEPKEKPKEKPKCWCESGHRNETKLFDGLGYVYLNFCPECGRKL